MKQLKIKTMVRGIICPLLMGFLLLSSASGLAQELASGEWATFSDGTPAKEGQTTNDHVFVRMDYDDTGTTSTYDNVISFKSSEVQTIWFWLDDDEIYLNERVQALPPTLIMDDGAPYDEITYNSLQCEIYLPVGISIITTVNEDGDEMNHEQGRRMPNSANFTYALSGNKVIDGIEYQVYTVIISNTRNNGTHFSAKNARSYTNYGALRKDDAPLFGLFLQNDCQSVRQGRLADIIIANQEFGMREPWIAGWEPNDYRFIYGTGGNNETQRFQKYNRIALYGSKGIDDNISFADANVKAICVQNWDTNGDGELSITEAAGVTSLNCVFHDNHTITSFDELQYFTGLTTIGFCDFQYCRALTSIIIPKNITTFGEEALWGCSSLTRIIVAEDNPVFDSRDNCNAVIETATNTLVVGSTNTTIPNTVTTIGYKAFGDDDITHIEIPNSVTAIGDWAFYHSRFKNVVIPNSVISLGRGVFQCCDSLKSVIIPESVTSISDYLFNFCFSLTSVTIHDSITSIGRAAFDDCKALPSICIPNSVSHIGNSAFSGCSSLTSIVVESGNRIYDSRDNSNSIIETASNTLIAGCKNTIIPNSVTSIGDYAFRKIRSLRSIIIPNSVTYIGKNAFYGTGLTSIIIPNSVTTIGDYAFHFCSYLSNITIPNSVTSIGPNAFSYCSSLTDFISLIIDPSVLIMGANVFYLSNNNYSNRTLHVPYGSANAYQTDANWRPYFDNIVEMDPGPATEIELSPSAAELTVGDTLQLTATLQPQNTVNAAVMWATNNSAVATVDDIGLVTALSEGTAMITAATIDGSNLSASCIVTVRSVNSDNYLSMSDTIVMHGETIVIPIAMTNDADIISFQTDIFLPEGIELLQEDGEYIIDPSSRMTYTHCIMSNDVSNGAIRVICYSSNYKTFTGQSGDDLLYLTVKVADDATGDYPIHLRNTLFTTSDFEELSAPDVAANVHVNAYVLGDANNSGTVTVTDIVVTSQYVLEMNPQQFIFEAADVNADGTITVTDVSRIAWMVLNPTLRAPLRASAIWNCSDCMSGNGVNLAAGETQTVSIMLDNEKNYSAFQFDLQLPDGLAASNFQLTDRASSHAFDVNTLQNGKIRVLCYSPALTTIYAHEGALLTFNVTATGNIVGDITVDNIELVTTACQTIYLDAFTIGLNNMSSLNELVNGKEIAKVEYFSLAGQRMTHPESGITLVVTTYTDGTRTTTKLIQ